MENNKYKNFIKIPKSPQELSEESIKRIDKKLDKQFYLIMSVFIIGFLTIIFMAIVLLIDHFRFNTILLKEYINEEIIYK